MHCAFPPTNCIYVLACFIMGYIVSSFAFERALLRSFPREYMLKLLFLSVWGALRGLNSIFISVLAPVSSHSCSLYAFPARALHCALHGRFVVIHYLYLQFPRALPQTCLYLPSPLTMSSPPSSLNFRCQRVF